MSEMGIALLIGVAFGAALERAGLGSARKLTGQFYLSDFAVFKVMFTAIVTAMLGLIWLSKLGFVDLTRVSVPETFLGPQIVGGLVFGGGLALAGLCPGTSCVAAATGRGDGVAVVGGLFAGMLVTGFALPHVPLLYSLDGGRIWTLPDLFHVSPGAAALGIVVIALAAFAACGSLERHA